MYDEIKSLEHGKGTPAFDSLFEKSRAWIQSYQDSFSNRSYTQRLLQQMDALKAIEKAPDFTLKDLNGNAVSLSDFRGKVVYLDFWATSCAPCVKEIPYYQNLQREFKDEQVVFLFVSIGDSEAPLKAFLKSRGFTGKHLLAPEGFGSEVARQYKISGLPKYIVVDRNGLVFNSDAPRPSGNPQPVLHAALEKM
jgi:peroxiredoxin